MGSVLGALALIAIVGTIIYQRKKAIKKAQKKALKKANKGRKRTHSGSSSSSSSDSSSDDSDRPRKWNVAKGRIPTVAQFLNMSKKDLYKQNLYKKA